MVEIERALSWRSLLLLAALFAACDGESQAPTVGARFAIQVAPLDLPGLSDARYTLSVSNGLSELVWSREVSSTAFGDGAGSVSYVGACDAGEPSNTVTLVLEALYDAGGEVPTSTYANPTPISRTLTCLENADVSVVFDMTIVRAAEQGFFDIAVSFSNVFCSAKLDCEDNATGQDLLLLHDPTGRRAMTAVLGFACTGGIGGPTYLYMDAPQIQCTGAGFGTPVIVDPTGQGSVDLNAAPSQNPNGYLFGASVFRGDEGLYSKSYWNISLGLDNTTFAAAGDCTLTARATVFDRALSNTTGSYQLPTNGVYPVIDWVVPLSNAAGRVCSSHEVNEPGSGVATAYLDGAAAPPGFPYQYAAGVSSSATPPSCVPACENGGVCQEDHTCDCSGTGYSGPTCVQGPITPTTWDPNHRDPQRLLSEGDLYITGVTTNNGGVFSVEGVSSGKWYYEFETTGIGVANGHGVGLAEYSASTSGGPTTALHWGYLMEGDVNNHGTNVSGWGGETWTVHDTIGVAVDFDSAQIGFYKNGALQGWISSPALAGKTVYAYVGSATSDAYQEGRGNFGQGPFMATLPAGFQPGWGHITPPGTCTPGCANGGICTAQNKCDCAGTGYEGPTCEMGPLSPFTPTTWDESHRDPQRTLSDGDLYVTGVTTNNGGVFSVAGVSSGKWYYEFETTAMGDHSGHGVGLAEYSASTDGGPTTALHWGYLMNGDINDHGSTSTAWADPWDLGDTIGVALDMDGYKIGFYKNGVFQGWFPSAALEGKTVYAYVGSAAGNAYQEGRGNFGQAAFVATVPELFHPGFGD